MPNLTAIQRQIALEKARREKIKRHGTDKPRISFHEFCEIASRGRFPKGRHIDLLHQKLQDVADGKILRLMIFMPPRHCKSLSVSHYFPAYYLGMHSDRSVLLTSYAAEFAASWGRKARDLLVEWGPKIFGVRVSDIVAAADHWEIVPTVSGGKPGVMETAGVMGPTTGKGAHLFIMDDLVKNQEGVESETMPEKHYDWYQSTAFTRLERIPVPGAIVLVMTRWDEDDIAGKILEAQEMGGDKWEVLSLPAICEEEEGDPLGRKRGEPLWPEGDFGLEVLERIKANMTNPRWWFALYQQSPIPPGGSVFKAEWLKFVEPHLLPERFDRIIQGWDTALKDAEQNDYSACCTIGLKGMEGYVLEIWQERLDFPSLIAKIKFKAHQWKATNIVIENKASGISAYQTIKKSTLLPVNLIQLDGDKTVRAELITPQLSNGRVKFKKADWNVVFTKQALSFPRGKNDDMVDAFVYAVYKAMGSAKRKARQYAG